MVIWVYTKSFVGKHPEVWALMAPFCQNDPQREHVNVYMMMNGEKTWS